MKDSEDIYTVNEHELLHYYGYQNNVIGKCRIRLKFLKSWILHSLAYYSPHSGFAISIQRVRGVKIGKNCHISPYVQIDLVYPHLIQIENNVTIATNTLIFAHVNPTANLFLKKTEYPRKVKSVVIKSGVVLFPGSIIIAGVTIGENSLVGAGSVVANDVPEYSVVVGNPARIVKKIDH